MCCFHTATSGVSGACPRQSSVLRCTIGVTNVTPCENGRPILSQAYVVMNYVQVVVFKSQKLLPVTDVSAV